MRMCSRPFRLGIALVLLVLVGGCSQPSTSLSGASASVADPAGDPEAVIRTYLDAINDEDFDAAAALFAPNAVMMHPTGAGPPETLASAEDVAAFLEEVSPACQHELVGTQQDSRHTLAAVIVSGDDCPVPAGTEIEIPFRIVDGRIDCICPAE